jgi:3-(3-hydroxy-phenyl)propionate hydroxylase
MLPTCLKSWRKSSLADLTICSVSIEFVQAQSIANKKQLETKEPVERKKTLGDLAATASDPVKARQYLLRSSMLSMQARAASITLEQGS